MTAPKNILKWAVGVFVTLLLLLSVTTFVDLRFKTARRMEDAAAFLGQGHTESELRTTYRLPHAMYSNYNDLPAFYQRGIHSDTNCTFWFIREVYT